MEVTKQQKRSIMDQIPSNIMFDIFSRVPARCLARSRCVSKVWCKCIDDRYLTIIHDQRAVEEPTPILYHQQMGRTHVSLCFHVGEFKQIGKTHLVFEPKKGVFLEFLRNRKCCEESVDRIEARGSCNGLILLSQHDRYAITSLAVIHPLRKEYYELPPFPLNFTNMGRESCGLGYDAFTSTWKLVCVLLNEYTPSNKPDMVKRNLCTMVHVFGKSTWREIPQVPSYPVTGIAIFANGCLHWLAIDIDMKIEDGGRDVIWFNVNKEEFGLIKCLKSMSDRFGCSQLVDTNGEVGYVRVCDRTVEVWVLKQKEWVPHCRFEEHIMPYGYKEVLGRWNKDGDILIRNTIYDRSSFFVYNLKSGVLHTTNVAGSTDEEEEESPGIFMYPNSLSSIHGINANSFSMKKTRKNCHKEYILG